MAKLCWDAASTVIYDCEVSFSGTNCSLVSKISTSLPVVVALMKSLSTPQLLLFDTIDIDWCSAAATSAAEDSDLSVCY